MAKLHFKYGAMNSGKSTMLLQTAYNYEEKGKKILLIKAEIDTKGKNRIVSRIGASREVDILLKPDASIISVSKNYLEDISCLLVDEAQFLSTSQVNELFVIAKCHDIPVIAFGLKSDFRSELFIGSKRLIELADEILEIPTICKCGKKARFNARKIDGEFTLAGNSIAIDKENNVEYEPLCGNCYIKKVIQNEYFDVNKTLNTVLNKGE